MLTEAAFKRIMRAYGNAWEKLDSSALVKIFTRTGTYRVRPFERPYRGHKGIRRYWDGIVKVKEKNVRFALGRVFVNDDVGVAEWKARFTRRDNGHPEELRGIILAKVRNGKIRELWEYWDKKEMGGTQTKEKST